MRREPHENVATVLVDPSVLPELELVTMAMDLRLWSVRHAPIVVDGERMAFQVRRRLIERHRGAWDHAADWAPVWIGFGPSWRHGEEPLPWSAHQAMWDLLAGFGTTVLFHKRLGGVRRIQLPAGLDC